MASNFQHRIDASEDLPQHLNAGEDIIAADPTIVATVDLLWTPDTTVAQYYNSFFVGRTGEVSAATYMPVQPVMHDVFNYSATHFANFAKLGVNVPVFHPFCIPPPLIDGCLALDLRDPRKQPRDIMHYTSEGNYIAILNDRGELDEEPLWPPAVYEFEDMPLEDKPMFFAEGHWDALKNEIEGNGDPTAGDWDIPSIRDWRGENPFIVGGGDGEMAVFTSKVFNWGTNVAYGTTKGDIPFGYKGGQTWRNGDGSINYPFDETRPGLTLVVACIAPNSPSSEYIWKAEESGGEVRFGIGYDASGAYRITLDDTHYVGDPADYIPGKNYMVLRISRTGFVEGRSKVELRVNQQIVQTEGIGYTNDTITATEIGPGGGVIQIVALYTRVLSDAEVETQEEWFYRKYFKARNSLRQAISPDDGGGWFRPDPDPMDIPEWGYTSGIPDFVRDAPEDEGWTARGSGQSANYSRTIASALDNTDRLHLLWYGKTGGFSYYSRLNPNPQQTAWNLEQTPDFEPYRVSQDFAGEKTVEEARLLAYTPDEGAPNTSRVYVIGRDKDDRLTSVRYDIGPTNVPVPSTPVAIHTPGAATTYLFDAMFEHDGSRLSSYAEQHPDAWMVYVPTTGGSAGTMKLLKGTNTNGTIAWTEEEDLGVGLGYYRNPSAPADDEGEYLQTIRSAEWLDLVYTPGTVYVGGQVWLFSSGRWQTFCIRYDIGTGTPTILFNEVALSQEQVFTYGGGMAVDRFGDVWMAGTSGDQRSIRYLQWDDDEATLIEDTLYTGRELFRDIQLLPIESPRRTIDGVISQGAYAPQSLNPLSPGFADIDHCVFKLRDRVIPPGIGGQGRENWGRIVDGYELI